MPLEKSMLEFIDKCGIVSKTDLMSEFYLSGDATLDSLLEKKYVEYDSIKSDYTGKSYPVPNTIHLTSLGHAELCDMREVEERYKKELRWTRGLALSSLIIAFASLSIATLSLLSDLGLIPLPQLGR